MLAPAQTAPSSVPAPAVVALGPLLLCPPEDEDLERELIEYGKPRPLRVLAEKRFDYFDVTNTLDLQTLGRRTVEILYAQRIPVEVTVHPTAWHLLPNEARPRIVVRLANHRFSDFRVVGGVDYLGNWASLHLAFARELPTIPAPDQGPPPPRMSDDSSIGAIFVGIIGATMVLGGVAAATESSRNIGAGLCVGLFGLILAAVAFGMHRNAATRSAESHAQAMVAWQESQRQYARQHAAMIREISMKADAKYLVRNHPMSDMQLFCAAMEAVFKRVIHDLEQTGQVKLERSYSSNTQFFSDDGSRRSDAAASGV